VAAHRLCRARKDVPLEDGRTLAVGKLEVQVLHTPGHTPDGCCFLAGKALFTGDTLFVGECGRVDLADSDVEAMYDSLMRRLFELPDDLVVYPGHDYGRTSTSTIGREKRENYVLRPRTLPQFIAFMREP
jgi:glyoxylase-like metal-dependent hydrolase (beta-lactamase superfamily II)